MAVVEQVLIDVASGIASLRSLGTESNRQFRQVNAGVDSVNKQVTALARGFGNAGRFIIGAAGIGGIAAAMTKAVRVVEDYDTAFYNLKKTFRGTEAELAGITGALRDLALQPEVANTAAGLLDIASAAAQLGVATDEIVGFTKTVSELQVATDLGANAAQDLAQIANIFANEAGPQFDRLGSTIVQLGNTSATTESKIVDFGKRLAAAGKIAGLSEAEVLSFGAAAASVGIEAEAGGTALSQTFSAIFEAVKSGGEKLEVFARTAGLTAQQFRDAFEKDAAGAIVKFIEGLGQITEGGGNVFKVFEQTGQEGERLKRTLLSLAGSGDLLARTLVEGNRGWTENIALQNEAASRAESLRSQWNAAKVVLEELVLTVGERLLPRFKELLGFVSDFAQTEDFRAFGRDMADVLLALYDAAATTLGGIGGLFEELGTTIRNTSGNARTSTLEILGSGFVAAGEMAAKALLGIQVAVVGLMRVIIGLNAPLIKPFQQVFAIVEEQARKLASIAGPFKAAFEQMADVAKAGADRLAKPLELAEDAAAGLDLKLEELSGTIQGIGKQSGLAGQSTRDLAAAQSAANRTTTEETAAITRCKDAATKFAQEQRNVAEAQRIQTEASKKAVEELNRFKESLGIINLKDFEHEMKLAEQTLADLGAQGVTSGAKIDALAERVVKLRDDFTESGGVISQKYAPTLDRLSQVTIQGLMKKSLELEPIIGKPFAKLPEFADTAVGAYLKTQEAIAATTDTAKEFGSTIGAALGQVLTGATSIGGAIQGVLSKGVGDLFSGASGGGFLGNLFKQGGVGALGPEQGGILSGIGGFVSKIGGKVSGALTGVLGPSLAGAVTGGLGALALPLAGKLFSGLKKLFGGTPEWQKIGKAASRQLGVSLSENTAKEIEALKSRTGLGRDAAIALGLPSIIKEADITSESFGRFAIKAQEALAIAASGGKAAAEATTSVRESYELLIQKAEELGTTGSKAFFDMIMAARQSGVEIPAVTQFIEDRLGKAAEAFNSLVGGLGEGIGGGQAKNLGAIGSAIFEGLAAQSGGLLAAVDALGPSVDVLAERYAKLGITGSESFQRLMELRGVAEANRPTLESLSRMTEVMTNLGESTFLTRDAFNAFQGEAVASFNKLIAGGASTQVALQAAAPMLQQLINASRNYGHAIGGNTKGLIDQAAAMGLVKVEGTGMSAEIQRGFDRLLIGMGRIFGKEGAINDLLTGTVTAAGTAATGIQTAFGAAAQGVAKSFGGAVQGAVGQAQNAASALSSSLGKQLTAISKTATSVSAVLATKLQNPTLPTKALPPPPKPPAVAPPKPPPPPPKPPVKLPNIPKFEVGTPFVPRTGPAILHRGEAVLTADENRRRGKDADRPRRAVVINLVVDGRRQTIARLQNLLDDHEIRIPGAVVI